ncbi:hypothetical protein ACIGPN_06040 [Streptomyces afghaniensis]|uniref:hypothetical protein n=1 Tax=Streptomyces afghaniensis TaxID=66865 RepID=UPI0037CD03AD
MTYNLLNGYSVTTTRLADGLTEFETRNSAGESISVVPLGGAEAAEMITNLRVAVALPRA